MTARAGVPKVVVVILNWNLPGYTMRCLNSAAPLVRTGASIVVVDNGSDQRHWEELNGAIQASFGPNLIITGTEAYTANIDRGQMVIVRLTNNLGYAGGNNVGLRLALNSRAEWVVLLNNDCEVPPNFLYGLIGTAAGMARVGAIGCQLLSLDEPPKSIYRGGRRLYGLGAHWLTKWRKSHGLWRVNFVPFACVALSTEALRRIGLLDERYFAYVEDCEYCYRLAADGWTMAINLDVLVRHRISASLGRRSAVYYYYVARNTPMFIGERLKTPWRVFSLACFIAQSLGLIAILASSGRVAESRAVLVGWKDYLLKRTGAMPG